MKTIRPDDLPPAVLAALVRCVEAGTALEIASRKRPLADDYAALNAVDDAATHELGAVCWEWLTTKEVLAAVEKERADAAE